MAMFSSYVSHYQRVHPIHILLNHYKIPSNQPTLTNPMAEAPDAEALQGSAQVNFRGGEELRERRLKPCQQQLLGGFCQRKIGWFIYWIYIYIYDVIYMI